MLNLFVQLRMARKFPVVMTDANILAFGVVTILLRTAAQ